MSDNFSNLVLFVHSSFNISTLIAMLLVTLVEVGYIDASSVLSTTATHIPAKGAWLPEVKF